MQVHEALRREILKMEIDKITQGVLNVIDNGTFKQEGALKRK